MLATSTRWWKSRTVVNVPRQFRSPTPSFISLSCLIPMSGMPGGLLCIIWPVHIQKYSKTFFQHCLGRDADYHGWYMLRCTHEQGATNATFRWSIGHHLEKLHVCEVCTAYEYLEVIQNGKQILLSPIISIIIRMKQMSCCTVHNCASVFKINCNNFWILWSRKDYFR